MSISTLECLHEPMTELVINGESFPIPVRSLNQLKSQAYDLGISLDEVLDRLMRQWLAQSPEKQAEDVARETAHAEVLEHVMVEDTDQQARRVYH